MTGDVPSMADLFPEATAEELDDIMAAFGAEDLDPENAAIVKTENQLTAEVFLAESREAFSKFLRRHCDYSPADVAAMDLREMAAAVKAESGVDG